MCRAPGRGWHLRGVGPRAAAEQLPGPLRPRRRGSGRGPHVHLLRARDRRRPHQQLATPRRDEGRDPRVLHRRHAGPDPVRRPLLHGPPRLAHRPHRRAAHRLALRGGQHADHDPDGDPGPQGPRRRLVREVPALGRLPAGRSGRRGLAVRRRQQVHRPLPGEPRDLVLRLRLRRQRPAGQEVLRPAHRVGHGPRRGLAGRAHADPGRDPARRRDQVHRRRLPVGLRQDQHGHDDPHPPGLEGRVRRGRHRLDEVRRRRPALRRQPGGGLLRRGPRAPPRRRTRTP